MLKWLDDGAALVLRRCGLLRQSQEALRINKFWSDCRRGWHSATDVPDAELEDWLANNFPSFVRDWEVAVLTDTDDLWCILWCNVRQRALNAAHTGTSAATADTTHRLCLSVCLSSDRQHYARTEFIVAMNEHYRRTGMWHRAVWLRCTTLGRHAVPSLDIPSYTATHPRRW